TQIGGIRSGCMLDYNNTFVGAIPNAGMSIQVQRSTNDWGPYTTITGGQFDSPAGSVPWGGASGLSPWDYNDTRTGAFVENGFNYNPTSGLYDSGTATGGSSTTIVDTTKAWTTNMWANFTARRLSDSYIGYITANTATTLTVVLVTSDPSP